MNKETGKIYSSKELEARGLVVNGKAVDNDFIPVDPDDMTFFQKSHKMVSKYDSRSKLGKSWTEIRKAKTAEVKKRRKANRLASKVRLFNKGR
jgi:hypothetical protein